MLGRIEPEQENHQDEDDWRQAHRKKIVKARIANRTPSSGLVTANQNETFQPAFWVIEIVFTLVSQACRRGHFTKCETVSCVQSGGPCAAELFSANKRCPHVRRDYENQRTEHCETNGDARNQRFSNWLIGRIRDSLQTQFPPTGIELRRCDQLCVRMFHN